MKLFKSIKSFFKRKITVTYSSIEVTYDGHEHHVSYLVQNLPDGYSLTIESTTLRDASAAPLPVETIAWRVFSKRGKDATERFDVEATSATIWIKPKQLTIRSASKTKTWDSVPLTCNEIEVDGLIGDESVAASCTGTITNTGTVPNSIVINWDASTAKRENYEVSLVPGTLTVEPARLEAYGHTVEVTYDGLLHRPEVSAPKGTDIAFEYPEAFKDVGSYSVPFTATMPNHIPVRGMAQLRIRKAPLSVSAPSKCKTYDGAPLECPGLLVQGLADGESLAGLATGSITNAGTTENVPTIDWQHSRAKEQNYLATLHSGTLEVTPAPFPSITDPEFELVYNGSEQTIDLSVPIGLPSGTDISPKSLSCTDTGTYHFPYQLTNPNYLPHQGTASVVIEESHEPIVVTTTGGEFKYDGNDHGATQVEVSPLPQGYRLLDARSAATVRNVDDGVVTATCDILQIVNASNIDVTSRLRIIYNDGHISVTPRTLLAITYDARRPYTGKPISTSGRLSGLIGEETATLIVQGTQTEIGSSTNTCTVQFNGTARQSNYVVKKQLGTLTVEAEEKDSPAKTGKFASLTTATAAEALTAQTAARPASQAAQDAPTRPATVSPSPTNADLDTWSKPVIRTKYVTGGGSLNKPRRQRQSQARPVSERPDLETQGLGERYRPFGEYASFEIADMTLARELRALDSRTGAVIDALIDREPDALLFQCFGRLGDDLGECKYLLNRLFGHYSRNKYQALVWIHSNCQNVFLVYVALMARENYDTDKDALWDRFFKGARIGSLREQTEFKRMFVSYLYTRNMVVYEAHELRDYYTKTTLLHGGFSRGAWEDLWGRSLLPLAQEKICNADDSGTHILDVINSTVAYRPKLKAITQVLDRAPRSVIASILALAFKVAISVTQTSSALEMQAIENPGLSDTAIEALVAVLKKRQEAAHKTRTGPKDSEPSQTIIFISPFRMVFNTEHADVRLVWDAQSFPKSLEGARLNYYVNGTLRESQEIEALADQTRRSSGSISLKPCPRYDVETRVVRPTQQGSAQEIASISQSFQNSRPGCFEFIRESDNTYRFRDASERLTKRRRVLYLVDANKTVEPQCGMKLLNRRDAGNGWESMHTFEFEVEPGAAGLVKNRGFGSLCDKGLA